MHNWYNLPTYYDVSFSHEMQEELAFLKSIFRKYCPSKGKNLLEPACGTGRLMVPFCRAGYNCTGFDINVHALEYLHQKLDKNGLKAKIFREDMSQFSLKTNKYHAAYCTVDTFRHLLTEKQAELHLTKVSKSLKKNGIYILGLHLMTNKKISNQVIRWKSKRGRLTVKTSMTMLRYNEKRRVETLKVVLKPETKNQNKSYTSIYNLRTYTLKQFYRILAKTGVFEIINAYDEYYDMNNPIKLNNKTEYAVFLLRKNN